MQAGQNDLTSMRRKPREKGKRGNPLHVSDTYRRFVLDQLEEVGDVAPRAMFGGVGLYHRGLFFGIIAGDALYLILKEETRALDEDQLKVIKDSGFDNWYARQKEEATIDYNLGSSSGTA